jgi:hypothetical protein
LGIRKGFQNQFLEFMLRQFPKKEEVNFEVAPEESEMTYLNIGNRQQRDNGKIKKKKKMSLNKNTIKMKKMDMIIYELIS